MQLRCRYNRQIACILAPAICGIIGVVLINSGILFIRRAYIHSQENPVLIQSENEEKALAKVDRRLAVRILMPWRHLPALIPGAGAATAQRQRYVLRLLCLERGQFYVQDASPERSALRRGNGDQVCCWLLLSFSHEYLIADSAWFVSFIAAITVVAWSSFIEVESKILEKQGSKSVGCREAFRRRTAPVFAGAVVLFGVSVASFVYAFAIIGYIKPCAQTNPKPDPNPKVTLVRLI